MHRNNNAPTSADPEKCRLEEALRLANEEIEAITYSIAHDLRTPLMHIDGFAQLLQSSAGAALDRDNREHLERIISSTRVMGDLIGALLEYSRLHSAEMLISDVDLEDVLSEALELVRPWTHGRNIQWRRTGLPVVRGDENLLREVLVNLISNAVKYTAPRDPAVIEIGRVEKPQELIVFVRDNGVGFDMQYARRLFSPFQRMHCADAFRGVGMGLAKVRRILSRHSGRVWVEAEAGRGATFFISLPSG